MIDAYDRVRTERQVAEIKADQYRAMAEAARDEQTRQSMEEWQGIYQRSAERYAAILSEKGIE